MKGAREYANLFRTGQHGRLYFVSGDHARGSTFHIFVLPANIAAIPSGDNAPLNNDAVEVYGIIGGQPGWTEEYGWLHEGPWQADFEIEVDAAKIAKETVAAFKHQQAEDRAAHDAERVKGLLSSY